MSSQLNSPPRWHEVTAIFGGRFDPPHLGHREAVSGLFKNPGIKNIVIIPSASPPHKPAFASAQNRTEMARLCFKPYPGLPFPDEVSIDLRELVRSQSQPNRPSYSYETIQELRPLYPKLAFVLGTDQLAQLDTWYRFPEILELAHWMILDRKESGSISKAQGILQTWVSSGLIQPAQSLTWVTRSHSSFLTLVSTDAREISSTLIRETITKTGMPPEESLLPDVLSYLKIHKLYGI